MEQESALQLVAYCLGWEEFSPYEEYDGDFLPDPDIKEIWYVPQAGGLANATHVVTGRSSLLRITIDGWFTEEDGYPVACGFTSWGLARHLKDWSSPNWVRFRVRPKGRGFGPVVYERRGG